MRALRDSRTFHLRIITFASDLLILQIDVYRFVKVVIEYVRKHKGAAHVLPFRFYTKENTRQPSKLDGRVKIRRPWALRFLVYGFLR